MKSLRWSLDQQSPHSPRSNTHQQATIKSPSYQYNHKIVSRLLPAANEIIALCRPHELVPRTIFLQSHMYLLPKYMHISTTEADISHHLQPPITLQSSAQPKPRVYANQQISTLFEFVNQPGMKCLYKRYKEERTKESQLKDLTAKYKVLTCLTDYNQKTIQNVRECIPQNFPSSSHNTEFEEIQFDSNFESGNLHSAYYFGQNNQYFLLLQNDTNTHGYNQWFFFRVKTKNRKPLSLTILNMTKNCLMYKQGMLVSIFSKKNYDLHRRGWFKGGENLSYSATGFERINKKGPEPFYALSFRYEPDFENDEVFFSLNNPYTYSKAVSLLDSTEALFAKKENYVCERRNLGYTHSNNIVPSMCLTSADLPLSNSKKKAIVFLARQHPVETVGSYVMEGIVQYLSHFSFEAEFIMNKYRVVLIPIANPDGVIHGHSRCNMTGLDLNRTWSSEVSKQQAPETYAIRKYMKNLQQDYGIQYIFDLHGHSKMMNSFLYSCPRQSKLHMYLLPAVMSRIEPSFDFQSCLYSIEKDKDCTIRADFFKSGVKNTFTLENSYFGRQRQGRKEHFSDQDLKDIGSSIIKTLFILHSSRAQTMYGLSKAKMLRQIQNNIQKYQQTEQPQKKKEAESESDPQGDRLDDDQRDINMKDAFKKCQRKSRIKIATEETALKTQGDQPSTSSANKYKKRRKISIYKAEDRPNLVLKEDVPSLTTSGKLIIQQGRLEKTGSNFRKARYPGTPEVVKPNDKMPNESALDQEEEQQQPLLPQTKEFVVTRGESLFKRRPTGKFMARDKSLLEAEIELIQKQRAKTEHSPEMICEAVSSHFKLGLGTATSTSIEWRKQAEMVLCRKNTKIIQSDKGQKPLRSTKYERFLSYQTQRQQLALGKKLVSTTSKILRAPAKQCDKVFYHFPIL